MACTDVENCIPDPTNISDAISSIGRISNVGLNVIHYFLFAIMLVFVAYNVFMAIMNVVKSPSEDAMTKLREGLTNIVFAVLGLIALPYITFFLGLVLKLLGYTDGNNSYFNPPFSAGDGS
ncbi:MAG: hypothetical protein QG570_756 [Patescibacteria group bacterium]|nr:hypothetical protein [Patescibacteria group bacterium]